MNKTINKKTEFTKEQQSIIMKILIEKINKASMKELEDALEYIEEVEAKR